MIQTQTKILIKDNSGLLEGKCINRSNGLKRAAGIGNYVKVTITKAKKTLSSTGGRKKEAKNTSISSKSNLNELLIIQTRKPVRRYDGSMVRFHSNCGVCIALTGRKLQLGFKRIGTTVPFELKKRSNIKIVSTSNIIKLAKNLI